MIDIKINGKPVSVPEGTKILKAARMIGVSIPSLCYHKDLKPWAACGICVVKVEGSPRLVRACATDVTQGQNYITHDEEIHRIRKTVVELTLSNHPQECLTCGRNQFCELQKLAAEFAVREIPFERNVRPLPVDASSPSVILDPAKCIQCGRCVQVCQQLQDVWALEYLHRGEGTRLAPVGELPLNESPCIKCGQCAAHCPVGAIYEKDETLTLLKAINDPETHVVVQIAPAVRVAVGEAFGLPPGTVTTGKIYAALRQLGVDTVFDTNFAADLTIMEEGSELVKRLVEKEGDLPQLTSCCPAWTDYMEKYYPDMIPHFSSAKSPMMMQGALTKTYFAEVRNIDPAKIYSVAIMPCTAKKYEIMRDENMYSSGYADMDLVLTTREISRLFKTAGIDFVNLEEQEADSPIGFYSGAGTIFGVTGGVMEAAVRSAYYLVTHQELKDVTIKPVRGMEGIKVGEVDFKGTPVKVAVAHGLANVKSVLDEIRAAKEKGLELPYHFVEVMACRGGCIAGGGQPYGTEDGTREKRINGLYRDDEKSLYRCSHQNPDIMEVYEKYLGKPLSEKAHHLLHTHYTPRPAYKFKDDSGVKLWQEAAGK
ncbi:MAG: [FeFe] hydrogenase, group A [Spirochaetales bacterium]|nr:[FeFe] hydrogenase, group A [Spirochaetales bacterium]